MDTQQAPWRALLRQGGSANVRGSIQQRQAASAHQAPTPLVAPATGRRRSSTRGRKHGWRYHRPVRGVDIGLELEPTGFWFGKVWVEYTDHDDACDSPWYGCGEDGCCVDS